MKMIYLLLALLLAISPVHASERAQAVSHKVIPSGSTLQGVCGTASAVTYTVYGNAVQGANESVILAQGQMPSSTGVLYTAGAGIPGWITSIDLANTTAFDVNGCKLFIGGTAATNQILNARTIPANGQASYDGAGWATYDANGALMTSVSGGSSYSAGAGLQLVGTTFSIDAPVGVLSWLGTPSSANLRSAVTDESGTGALLFQSGDLGTPSAGILTNATGLPISTGVSGLASGIVTWLTTPSSANLRGALTDETGTGLAYFQGGDIGTPSAGVLTNATGLPISTGVSGLGTNVATALGTNVGTAGSFVVNGGVLGTPSSGTLTNATGLPISTGVSGLAANIATFLGTPSSANERSALTDETGTGLDYFQGGDLGTPSAGVLTNATGLPLSTGISGFGTGIAAALANNTGSAGAPVLFNGAGGTPSSLTLTNATGLPVATGISGLASNIATWLGTPSSANLRAAVTDESGTGNLLFQSGDLGTPTAGVLTNATGLPVSTGISGLGTGIAAALATNTGSAGAPVLFNGALGTPSSGTLTNATGLLISTGVSGLGTNVATALGTNVGTAGSFVVNGGVLGTPSSGTLTNATGLPISTGVSGLGTGIATWLGTPSSANLATALTDETGSGLAVFGTGPTLTSPILTGVASPTYTQGKLVYDTDNESLTFFNNDSAVSLQIGQEQWIRVTNNTGSTIANGAVVYVNGALAGVPTISLSRANLLTTTTVSGMMTESCTNGSLCYVTQFGIVRGIDTSAFSAGAVVYLSTSTAGGMTSTRPPPTSGFATIVGRVGVSNASTGTVLIQPGTPALRSELNAVADVGFVGDQRVVFDGACSTGANTKITSATAAFVADDVGKRITLATGGTSSAVLAATISAIDSGTQVTISGATCATNASGKGLQIGTDNTTAAAALVSYVNALNYPGIKVTFPPSSTNRYASSTKMVFTKPATITGQGTAVNQDSGDYTKTGGTALAWWGTDSDGGTAFDGFISFLGPGNPTTTHLAGAGLRDLWIDCRNGDQNPCAIGIAMQNNVGFDLQSLFVMDPLVCINMRTADLASVTASTGRGSVRNVGCRMLETVAGPTSISLTPTTVLVASNNQTLTTSGATVNVTATTGMYAPGYFWMMTHSGYYAFVKCTAVGSATTLTGCAVGVDQASDNPTLMTGTNVVQAVPNNGACLLAEGTTSTNTNLFDWVAGRMSIGTNAGAPCMAFHNADSITFRQVVINGGNATVGTGVNARATRPGVQFAGSAVGLASAARNNVFYDGDAGTGGVESLALNSAGVKITAPAGPNYWYGYQLGNTNQGARIENGSAFEWPNPNGGCQMGLRSIDDTANVPYTVGVEKIIPGTIMQLTPQCIQVGVVFHWRVHLAKTAAGTAARVTNIRIGATGTTADTLVQSFSDTGTNVLDNGVEDIYYRITVAPLTSSNTATGVGTKIIQRALGGTATGLVNAVGWRIANGTPTVFTSPVSGLWYISVTKNTGTAEVLTTNFAAGYIEKTGGVSVGP